VGTTLILRLGQEGKIDCAVSVAVDTKRKEGGCLIGVPLENRWRPNGYPEGASLDRCKGRNGRKVFRFNTLTWVSQKFKTYARDAGIGHAKFHDLRHTFGSHLAMSGENEAAIQKLMRHKSIASTLVYTKFSNAYLMAA
jgi:integrase